MSLFIKTCFVGFDRYGTDVSNLELMLEGQMVPALKEKELGI